MYEGEERFTQGFGGETRGKENAWENVAACTGSSWLRIGTCGGHL